MQQTCMGSSSLAAASSMMPSASTTAHCSRENCSSCSFCDSSPSRCTWYKEQTPVRNRPGWTSASQHSGTVPAAVTERVGCPAPCCSSASPGPWSSGGAEPAAWGSSARSPAPSQSAATLPSLPVALLACCSAGYHSKGHKIVNNLFFFKRMCNQQQKS